MRRYYPGTDIPIPYNWRMRHPVCDSGEDYYELTQLDDGPCAWLLFVKGDAAAGVATNPRTATAAVKIAHLELMGTELWATPEATQ